MDRYDIEGAMGMWTGLIEWPVLDKWAGMTQHTVIGKWTGMT